MLPHNLPYSLMTPSCGIIICPPNTRESYKAYTMGTEYDFYPDFICREPKSKWNLTKFDFLRTQENDFNWCILIARSTPTSGPRNSGTLQFKTPKLPSSIPKSLPSLSPHPTCWEETPNTRNNLIRYWIRPMTSSLVPSTGILWIVLKQNPNQAVPFPPSSPHHLCLCSQFASAELICAGVITTHLPLPLTLNCGNPLRSCNPEEEYITCVTAALQNLAHRSRTTSWDNRSEGPTLRRSRWVIPQRTHQTISEMDLTQRELLPLPFIHRSFNPMSIMGSIWMESPTPIQRTRSPGAVEITGFPPRPFLPKHIYLSTTIPSRNRDEQLAFLRHCSYLQQGHPSYAITHTLMELHLLTPTLAMFIRYLWRYKIYIN